VLAVGLADVTGSAILIWRFGTERRQPGRSEAAEVHAAIAVTAAEPGPSPSGGSAANCLACRSPGSPRRNHECGSARGEFPRELGSSRGEALQGCVCWRSPRGFPPGRLWTPASPMGMQASALLTAQPLARRRVAVSAADE
jgi:hypothetical protein